MKTATEMAMLAVTVIRSPGLPQAVLMQRLGLNDQSKVSRLCNSGIKAGLLEKKDRRYYPGEVVVRYGGLT